MNLAPIALAMKVIPARLTPIVQRLDRLRAEIAAAHAKRQRLDQSIRERTQTLNRLQAQLTLAVEPGAARSRDE